ncbi:hypothetical protein LTR53_013959 [Teratosphaeriaceae sp. CCFEE 6253]|nr:hypothetical protein LTR53_013959 [Teratosphaeriaceae sp. CCFEE 6253]
MAHFCCAHPQQRVDSPEPPSRPPLKIDGILAAAALPDCHPHALRFPDKKPELDSSIIRSPNLADKIKWHMRRKSTKALRSDEEYDHDALPMTSTEVVNSVGYAPLRLALEESPLVHSLLQPRSLRVLSTPVSLESFQPRDEVRDSVLKSLGWLRPLLERPPSIVASQPVVVAKVATATPSRQSSSDAHFPRRPPNGPMPLSLSSPNLLGAQHVLATPLRRTQSFFALGGRLAVPRTRLTQDSSVSESVDTMRPDECCDPRPAEDAVRSSVLADRQDSETVVPIPTSAKDTPLATSHIGQISSDSPHLHTMDISQQLRSMSALSEASEEDWSLLSANAPWNFHRRENSAIRDSSARTKHARRHSSCGGFGIDAAGSGRGKSPAASSNYSRPSSMLDSLNIDNDLTQRMMLPYEISAGFDGAVPDWPLPLPYVSTEVDDTRPATEAINAIQPLTHSVALGQNPPDSPVPVTTGCDDNQSIRWTSPLQRGGSLPSKDSSSHLTVSSMRSRFRDRLSSTKKLVRKRRSIFKFLRPGSRKQQGRSVSSPVLHTKASDALLYDGPSDDPEMLTVMYELSDDPQHSKASTRAASVGQLEIGRSNTTYLAVPDGLPQRRPSLADYERTLTATGDDRRRPSMINVQKLQELQEGDRRQSISLRRKISRAKTFSDEPTTLMAQALEKHQEEKALFRSASKQKEALEESQAADTVLSRTSTFTTGRISLPPSVTVDHNDLLDPLDRSSIKMSVDRSHSTGYLLPPSPAELHPRPPSFMGSSSPQATPSPATKTSPGRVDPALEHVSPQTPAAAKHIGSSLSSWTRFPSHTRGERCGSAGRADAVVARDFAFDDAERGASWDLEAGSPVNDRRGKGKAALPKRRSTTFGGLVRYYSSIFSSSASPQNRRSSIAAGGWLAQPDLELLPPSSSSEPTFPKHDHHFKQRLHQLEHDLEEQVKKDIDYIGDEATVIVDEIRKDVDYVEEKADELEECIRRDVEQVEDEAERLMHLGPRHHQASLQASASFLERNPFSGPSSHPTLYRNSTFVGPMDDTSGEDSVAPTISISSPPAVAQTHPERNTTLDGAADAKAPASRAEAWSSVYQQCIFHAPHTTHALDTAPFEASASSRYSLADDTAGVPANRTGGMAGPRHAMGPPLLKPIKARSPQRTKSLDPEATVRRFPSVTVIDDRKGHGRSISLISVKVGDGQVRSSTNGLIGLIESRERQEREGLLRGSSCTNTTTREIH